MGAPGLADRDRADADAGVVAALGHDLDLLAETMIERRGMRIELVGLTAEYTRDELLALPNEVTSRIAATLRLELIEAEGRRLEHEHRSDSEALDAKAIQRCPAEFTPGGGHYLGSNRIGPLLEAMIE